MERAWWETCVFYQIFVRSFQDSNGDGIGDLLGIEQRLSYFKDLGVEVLLLSPIFPSSKKDGGYDITEFRAIDPDLGTMDDFISLITKAHARGIKIVLDLQIMYTSTKHAWFKESQKGPDSDKNDFYFWSDTIPNNWRSYFGGKAWTKDVKRGQYYLHSFLPEAPDLNWRNEKVVAAMKEELKFWLDLGIDGYKINGINLLVKDKTLRNNPTYPGRYSHYNKQRHIFDRNRPLVHRRIRSIRDLINTYDDKVLIGEVVVEPPGEPEMVASYYGTFYDELNLAMDYSLINLPFKSDIYQSSTKRWYDAVDRNWPAWILSNQDHERMASKFKGNENMIRMAAMFFFTQKGSLFMYYGQELGLENSKVRKSEIKDTVPRVSLFGPRSRDGERGPMVWDSHDKYGGFSSVKPWIPMILDRKKFAVNEQKAKVVSTFHYYQKFIQLRKHHPALMEGDCTYLSPQSKGVFAYLRSCDEETLLVVLNFNKKSHVVELNKLGLPFSVGGMIFSTNPQSKEPERHGNTLKMQGYEGAIYPMLL